MIHLVLMIQESYHLYGLSEFASSFFEEEEKNHSNCNQDLLEIRKIWTPNKY